MRLHGAYKSCTIHYHYKCHNNKNVSTPVLQPISICDRIPMDGHGKAGHGDLKTGQNEEEVPGFKKKSRHGVCGGENSL